jgi:hypothetical protein
MRKINVQNLFIIACSLKVASAVAALALNSPVVLGFFVPLGVMALYILLGIYRRNDDVSKEKFADSCYYLGFIFTIASIAVALVDLPNIGVHMQDIAVRFGASMASTVVGLMVRVGMVTFQKDLNDAVRHAEEGVVEASIQFRDHLGFALERLKSFENEVDQASRLSVERVNLNVENLSKNHAEKLAQFFTELTKGNQTAFDAALSEVKESTAVLSLALKKLRGKASVAEESLETVSRLATQQQALFDATQGQVTALEKVSSNLSGIDGILAAIVEELNTGSARTAEVRDKLAQFLQDGTGAFREVTFALKEVARDLSQSSAQNQQSFVDAQKTFDVAVDAYRILAQRVDASTEVMTGKLLEGANVTLKAAERIAASAAVTENAASKLEGVAAADVRVAHTLKTLGETARAGLQRFDIAVEKLQTMVAQLTEVRRTLQQFTPLPNGGPPLAPAHATPTAFSYSAPERHTLGERPAASVHPAGSLESAYAAAHPEGPAQIQVRPPASAT